MYAKHFLLLTIFLFSSHSFAKDTIVAGLRQNEQDAEAYSQKMGLPLLQKSVEEFSNGNTFVRLKQNVAFSRIEILIPSEMDSNSLMETLITIFTLKKNGASSVSINLEAQKSEIYLNDLKKSINIEAWLSVAGADKIILNSQQRSLKILKRKNLSPIVADTVIVSIHHDTLARDLSQLMNLPMASLGDLESVKRKHVLLVSPAPTPVNLNFFETLIAIEQLKSGGAKFVELLTPYLPYARSDKVDQFGIATNGKLIANLVEFAGADVVSFVRAHAPQSEGFFNVPTRNIAGRKTINTFLQTQNVEVIVSPDAGFQKDATLYAEDLKIDVAVINKHRDPLTGKIGIVGISGPAVKGKTLAIIDDETSSGSTLGKAAEFLKKLGAARILAVVTHLTGDALGALDNPAIDRVIVTDTLPISREHPKLSVLSIADEVSREVLFSRFERRSAASCHQLFGLSL